MTARDQYIAGLRALADLLDADETMPLPYDGTGYSQIAVFYHGSDSKDGLAAFARAFPGRLEKVYDDESEAFGFELRGTLGGPDGLGIRAVGDRTKVCRRVVTGTRTEIREEPITQVVGKRSVPVEVETVEWICDEPLLAEATS